MAITKLVATLTLPAALLLGACTATDDNTSTSGIDKGLGSQDAATDVTLVSFTGPDSIGGYTGTLEITNHSSKTSNYYIEVNIEDAAGTVIGWSNALVQKLEPNASAKAEFQSFDDGAVKAVITEIQRTAS